MSYVKTHVNQNCIGAVEPCHCLTIFISLVELLTSLESWLSLAESISLLTRQSPKTWFGGSNPSLSASKKRPAELVKAKRLCISNASAVSTLNSMVSGWLRPVCGLENPQESNIS